MINETLMSQGSFDIPLNDDIPYSLLTTMDDFGHIVIVDQWIEPAMFADAAILAAARYTGVVLGVVYNGGAAQIRGAGLAWWLGSDNGDIGPVIEVKQTLSAANLDTSLTALLPSAVTKGTVSEPGGSYTGQHQWETPLSAIRTVCGALGAEFRVNPDGTLDSAASNTLFNIDVPNVVVVRTGWGSDPTYRGIPSDLIQTTREARAYATKVLLLEDNLDGTLTSIGSDTRSTSYKDIHGNTMARTVVTRDTVPDNTALTTFLAGELAEWDVETMLDVDTSSMQTDATFNVGDSFWCYDPPVVVDVTNQIQFRGQVINPVKLRLLEASWPLVRGMGIFYRDLNGVYTDLSRFVDWEK